MPKIYTLLLHTILLVTAVIFSATSLVILLLSQKRPQSLPTKPITDHTYSQQLQLQAYERLTLLVDRIALPNLIPRVNQVGLTAKEMQLLLTRTLKDEFDHNTTQQIYISAEAWSAVKNLKEQNLLAINQLANALPPAATGMELNKALLDYMINDKKANLHEVVSEILSYEVKKIL